MEFLQDHLPLLFHAYNTVNPTVSSVYQLFSTAENFFFTQVYPFLAPLVSTFNQQILSSPDLTSIALLVCILLVSLTVFRMLWRLLMASILFVIRAVFIGSMLIMGLLIYVRGWGLVDDIAEWGQEMGRVYEGEKGRWESVVRQGGPASGGRDARRGMSGGGIGTWR
ncbi:MAG: hypothetical protein M1837_005619 [Sclerophora amabilis]|nr:MAG: hypothetical protein M1837_005619 [Sclerophora amabilis]